MLGKDTFVHQRFKDYTLKHHFHEQNANNANTHTNTEDMLGAGTGLQCLALAVITVIKQSLLFHHSKNKWSSKTRKQKKKNPKKKDQKEKKIHCLVCTILGRSFIQHRMVGRNYSELLYITAVI